MTAISKRVRGATIGFSSTFVDAFGDAYTPPSATLRLVYKVDGAETTVSHTMTLTGATARYAWDSSIADADSVYWFVTTGGSSKAVDEGQFLLVANRANPDPS
jgi:hypothetical protein